MSNSRREFLAIAKRLAEAWALSLWAWPWPSLAKNAAPGRAATAFEIALASELNTSKPIDSERLHLEAPQIAEDGAIVPISLSTDLPDIGELVILVEKNPTPLAARFRISKSAKPNLSLRIKMNETCDVVVLAKSPGGVFITRANVKVLVGGCG